MKFKIGDHLQDIGSTAHGIVTDINEHSISGLLVPMRRPYNPLLGGNEFKIWYLIENDELGLVNHWIPEGKLELHKQTLRELKLNELGI